MAHEFPKKEHYSNSKMMIDKNLLKSLLRLEELKRKVFWTILDLCLHEKSFAPVFNAKGESNGEFKDIETKFNNNIKSIFSCSHKTYPENVFKVERRHGLCEACNNKRGLEKVHIIKKSVFKQPYSQWLFLKFHPINIIFLCRDCHDMFDGRITYNGEQRTLSANKMNRIKKNLNERIRRIKIAMKSDKKYFQDCKESIDTFNTQKKNIVSRLFEHLNDVYER